MKHISLFSGIGGFDLAAEWAGWENVAHCEINTFGQQVLKHYWPKAETFTDITKADLKKYHGTIDIISGGFPCQPFSLAGKRAGTADTRHLWPQMLRIIGDVRPRYVVGENVFGLVNWDGGMVFDAVFTDLESLGYQVSSVVVPACSINAPHRRDRVWFVAYSDMCRNNNNKGTASGFWEQQSKDWEGNRRASQISGFSDERVTPNPNGSTTRPPGTGFGVDSNRSDNDLFEGERGKATQLDTGCDNVSKPTPNTTSSGCKGQHEQRQGEGKFRGCNCKSDATNPSNQGLQRGKDNGSIRKSGAKRDKQFSGRIRSNWQDFPTQSPVCGGDDGLPSKLDGITFPKWRNESIKAYGNAIVPQVAYQIFNVINQLENDKKTGHSEKTCCG